MWNLLQAVLTHVVCKDDGLNVTGMGRTQCLKGSYRSSIPTAHCMEESLLQCRGPAPRSDGHLADLGPRLRCGQLQWILLNDNQFRVERTEKI